MRPNHALNIINIVFISIIFSSVSFGSIACGDCPGCSPFWPKLVKAAQDIDDRHHKLEKKLNKYYKEMILPLQKQTELLQKEITRLSAHLEIMQKESVIDNEKIIHYIQKAKTSVEQLKAIK